MRSRGYGVLYDTPRKPLGRVLERPDGEVPAALKARPRASALRFDLLGLEELREGLVAPLPQPPSHAQQTDTPLSEGHKCA